MLSIIISSYQPDYFSALEKNIAETCGMPYEIIKIDNPGVMGICEAYNKGAEKAIYDNLLFLHEDVLFETDGWGTTLINYLKDERVGCIGVAGANYVPLVPSGWWKVIGNNACNIIQVTDNGVHRDKSQGKKRMKILDGVFIACKKEVWENSKFDEVNLTGYHGYDTSFSFTVSVNFQNYVIGDILIRHFSGGRTDKDWLNALITVWDKKVIPISKRIGAPINKETEMFCYKNYIEYVFKNHNNSFNRFFLSVKYIKVNRLGFYNTLKLLKKIYYSYKFL